MSSTLNFCLCLYEVNTYEKIFLNSDNAFSNAAGNVLCRPCNHQRQPHL